MPKFEKIKPFTRSSSYSVMICWRSLEKTLKEFSEDYELQMDPDFQRNHVGTEEQQSRYVEFRLRQGRSGKDIYFNCSQWQMSSNSSYTTMDLVDGKQRLQAVRRFLNNEIPVFGSVYREYEDKLNIMTANFIFHVNDLQTKKEVLQWYVDLNDGGIAHTTEEIEKVKELIKAE